MGVRNRPLSVIVLATALLLSACSTGSSPSSPSASSQASDDPASSVVAAATPIPIGTDPDECRSGAPCHCSEDAPCQFEGGTYATFGRWAFLPGLTMTIPAGWYSTEQDAGEFSLAHPDLGVSGLLFWRDMIPVDLEGNHLANVPSTPQGLTGWLRANPNLIVSEPEAVTIGQGIEVTTFTFSTSPGAPKAPPLSDCPNWPPGAASCFPILTDPMFWDGAWWTASIHATRLYLASIGPASSPHLLIVAVIGEPSVSIEADPLVELERIEEAVQPILDSLDVSDVTFNCNPCS